MAFATLTGPGLVFLESMSFPKFVRAVQPSQHAETVGLSAHGLSPMLRVASFFPAGSHRGYELFRRGVVSFNEMI
jgi:hypothetical protein